MKLTKVEASSMQEALRKIRTTLGNEAMIVGTRTFRRGGVLGLGGREVVEVYVADNRPRVRNLERETARRLAEEDVGSSAAAQAVPRNAPAVASLRPPGLARVGDPAEMERLSRALGELRKEVRELVREKEEFDHPFLRDALTLLLERDVDPKLATRVVGQLRELPLPVGIPEPARVRSVVRSQLERLFLPNLPARRRPGPRVILLVGPTGVGKTTSIAKLAARAKLTGGQKVGLVTLDTFRIAAVDQLQKYAQIIGVPLAVASDPVELRKAVRSFERDGVDAVFVDSAGRNQRDEMKMAELKEFLQVLPGVEVHLVLSTTTQPKTMKNVVERFDELKFHRVILTKLDETASFGAVLEALVVLGRPISFLTDGQNVPDDLMISDPGRLADMVLRPNNG